MAADGVIGYVKLAYSEDSPVSWTAIPQVINADLPEETTDRVDTTTYSATRRKKDIPGMIQTSPLKITLLYDPDETTTPGQIHEALRQYKKAGTTIWWRYEVATDMECTKFRAAEFKGYVASFSVKAPMGDKVTADVEISFNDTDITMYAAAASGIS